MLQPKQFKTHTLIALLLALITLAIYSPGINGPFIFDDQGNILENSQIRINEISSDSLIHSAFSGQAGPLKRPIAMLSFALNYYFAGSYDAFTFKATNIGIQIICAWLFFIFCQQLLRLTPHKQVHFSSKKALFFAFSMSLIWATHPINLTSILYIVQRMTSLSTLFTLACLILYISARETNTTTLRSSLLYTGSFSCFLLAIFSKENALLTPLYIVLIEWCFFSTRWPWRNFKALPLKAKGFIYLIVATALLIITSQAFDYALSGYNSRVFTLEQRTLTEARVLSYYLGLIILPRINAFGLFHDDIQLSHALNDPWSTLASFILILLLIFSAIRYKKVAPLYSFGILFFFTAHLMESTIFGLEIAHEHRNHLASTGIIIALSSLFIHSKPYNGRAHIAFTAIFFLINASTTLLRSQEWSNEYTLAKYEANHHPESPASLGLLSNAAFEKKEYQLALKSINKARLIAPTETAYAINHLVLTSLLGMPIDTALNEDIKHKLLTNPFTPSTQTALAHISLNLNNDGFKPLQVIFTEWLQIIVKKLGKTQQASLFHYFLAKAHIAAGKTLPAINSYQQAFDLDNKFINPLFEMGNIFLALKQATNAQVILKQIRLANKNPALNRNYDKHIVELSTAIATIKQTYIPEPPH